MQNRLEKFYGELDECYLRGDLDAVERFLLEWEAAARRDPCLRSGGTDRGLQRAGLVLPGDQPVCTVACSV